MLQESLRNGKVNPAAPKLIVEGTKNGIKSLMKDIEIEIREYEIRRNGQ